MDKKIVQIILVLVIGLLLVSASPLSIIDEGDNGGERWFAARRLSILWNGGRL